MRIFPVFRERNYRSGTREVLENDVEPDLIETDTIGKSPLEENGGQQTYSRLQEENTHFSDGIVAHRRGHSVRPSQNNITRTPVALRMKSSTCRSRLTSKGYS